MPPLLRFRTFVFGREVDMHEICQPQNKVPAFAVRITQEAGDQRTILSMMNWDAASEVEIQGREEAREREGDRD